MILDVLIRILDFYMPAVYLGVAVWFVVCVGVSWVIVAMFTARIGEPKIS
jgi:hypothetical protein